MAARPLLEAGVLQHGVEELRRRVVGDGHLDVLDGDSDVDDRRGAGGADGLAPDDNRNGLHPVAVRIGHDSHQCVRAVLRVHLFCGAEDRVILDDLEHVARERRRRLSGGIEGHALKRVDGVAGGPDVIRQELVGLRRGPPMNAERIKHLLGEDQHRLVSLIQPSLDDRFLRRRQRRIRRARVVLAVVPDERAVRG